MWHLLIQARQVKLILDVLLINFSKKKSFPRRPQNQEIHDTSSELLIFLPNYTASGIGRTLYT
jgi:hypothetical protein